MSVYKNDLIVNCMNTLILTWLTIRGYRLIEFASKIVLIHSNQCVLCVLFVCYPARVDSDLYSVFVPTTTIMTSDYDTDKYVQETCAIK